MSSRLLQWVIAGLLLLKVGAGETAFAQHSEAEVKAAFIFTLTRYVEWPAESLPAGAPLRACITGPQTALGDALHGLAGKAVRGHPFEVRTGIKVENSKDCHVLIVQSSGSRTGDRRGLLTIVDQDDTADTNSMVCLSIVDNRVQFDANVEAARRSELQLSAQLLKLARRVK